MKTVKLGLAIFFFLICLNVHAEEKPILTNIKIDGVTIQNFSSTTLIYDLEFAMDTSSIKITPEYDNSLYKINSNFSITGTANLKFGLNTFTITVVSLDDDTNKTVYTINAKRDASTNNALASLTVAGKRVTLTDVDTEYEVKVDKDAKMAKIEATLADINAEFPNGYGERTVELNGEKTVAEVKVKAQNGEIRTYTITIIKSNYQSNDASLKSLKIKEIEFNFNPTIYEYNLEVKEDIEKINLEAVANDEDASVTYEKTKTLDTGLNKILITVTAADGTKKDYIINITKQEAIPLVENIKIQDITFTFNPNIYQYEIKTDLTKLNFDVLLNDKEAKVEILNNESLKNGTIIKVVVTKDTKRVTYNFKVIQKDVVITPVEKPNNLTTSVSNSPFLEKYEMYIGLFSFGLGLLSLLVAILTRPKDSQIM